MFQGSGRDVYFIRWCNYRGSGFVTIDIKTLAEAKEEITRLDNIITVLETLLYDERKSRKDEVNSLENMLYAKLKKQNQLLSSKIKFFQDLPLYLHKV